MAARAVSPPEEEKQKSCLVPADRVMSHFSPPDAELHEYRPISALAVAALALALASPLALVSLAWAFLPLAGMGASAGALYRIRRSESAMLGRAAALAGLLVSAAVAAAAPTRAVAARQLVLAEARHVADDWFRALAEGRADRAFLWTLDPAARPALKPDAIAEFYARGPRWREELASYVRAASADASLNPVAELLRMGRKVRVGRIETTALGAERETTVVYLTCRVEPTDISGNAASTADAPAPVAVPRDVLVRLERRRDEAGAFGWRLAHVEFVER